MRLLSSRTVSRTFAIYCTAIWILSGCMAIGIAATAHSQSPRFEAVLTPSIGHGAEVRHIALSADGRYLVSADNANVIKLWHVVTGKLVRDLQPIPLPVRRARTPEQESTDEDGSFLRDLHVMALKVARGGRFVIAGDNQGRLHRWDGATGRLSSSVRAHTTAVGEIALSFGEDVVVSAAGGWTQSKGLATWSLPKLAQLATRDGDYERLVAAPDGALLAARRSRSDTDEFKATAERLALPHLDNASTVTTIPAASNFRFASDGLSALIDGTRLVDLATGSTVAMVEKDYRGGTYWNNWVGPRHLILSRVNLDHSGFHPVNEGRKDWLAIWDGAKVSTSRIRLDWDVEWGMLTLTEADFSADGTLLAVAHDRHLKLFETRTGKLVADFGGPSSIISIALSPDEQDLMAVDLDRRAQPWKLLGARPSRSASQLEQTANEDNSASPSDGTYRREDRYWTEAIRAIVPSGWSVIPRKKFSVDNRLAAQGAAPLRNSDRFVPLASNKAVGLWDLHSGTLVKTMDLPVTVAAVEIWDEESNEMKLVRKPLSIERVAELTFSNDRRVVLMSAQLEHQRTESTFLWRESSGWTRLDADKKMKLPDDIGNVVLSPDGRWIALDDSGVREIEIQVRRVENLEIVKTLRIRGNVNRRAGSGAMLQFSHAGRYLWATQQSRASMTRHVYATADWRKLDEEAFSYDERSVAFFAGDSRILESFPADYRATLRANFSKSGKPIAEFKASAGFGLAIEDPSGQRLLMADGPNLRLVRLADGRELARLEGHTATIASARFLRSRNGLVSAGSDGTARFWDLDKIPAAGPQTGGVPVLRAATSHVAGDGGRWLTWSHHGFIAGPRGGEAMLTIVTGLDVTSIDQVHQSLFNPDLILAAAAGDPKGEVAAAAKVINLDKVLDSGPAPTVAISAPAATSLDDLVTVSAKVTDKGKGIGRIEWRVNGVTAAVAGKPDGPGPDYALSQPLALDPGPNTIELTAYNGLNLLASVAGKASLSYTGPADATKPRLHVLAIGIDQYTDTKFPKLSFARSDAEAFSRLMERVGRDEKYYTGTPNVLALPEAQATRHGIERAIDEMAKAMHPRDTFILFAAAHGTSQNGRFYLIPHGFRSGPDALEQTAVGQTQLQEWFANKVKARRVLVLLDTCASGALVGGAERSRVDIPASEAAVGRLHEATGRPVLTAAATGKGAAEGYRAKDGKVYGVFTYAVLEAFRKGDTDGNGEIDLVKLAAHVQKRVPEIAAAVGATATPRGAATKPADQIETSPSSIFRQSARFGSRGDNFVIGRIVQ
jgi:WD40 repeat protein